MLDQSNRTFVCSVLFLDIVEYTKQSVAEQIKQKQRFNTLLSHALQPVDASERVILDTGDGAAISFLGSPEEALFVATALRDGSGPDTNGTSLPVRSGINLGPVRLVKDINGQLNIIGDGINVAQRVMGFSQTGQILASRSYYEVVSRLAEDYAQLFKYEGSRTDKHVREHEVYAIGATHPGMRAAAVASGTLPGYADTVPIASASSPAWANFSATGFKAAGSSLKVMVAAPLIFILMVSGGLILRHFRHAPAAQPEPTVAILPARPEPKPSAQPASPERPKAPLPPRMAAAARHAPVANAVPKAVTETPRGKTAAKVANNEPASASGPAKITLTVLPWGEVFLDGRSRGISPPLKVFEISSGKHSIEIRNTSFRSYIQSLDVRPGEQISIRHKF